jgi:hypothetical protein
MRFYRQILFSLILTGIFHAQGASFSEDEIKTSFLYHFAKYVTWPQSALSDNHSPFIIGVLGRDPLEGVLKTLEKNQIGDHPIIVKHFVEADDVKDCHILYISRTEESFIEDILLKLKGKPVLTLSDIPHFIAAGGMIRFVQSENKIKFEINQRSVEDAGLKMSSQLLKLAINISPTGD